MSIRFSLLTCAILSLEMTVGAQNTIAASEWKVPEISLASHDETLESYNEAEIAAAFVKFYKDIFEINEPEIKQVLSDGGLIERSWFEYTLGKARFAALHFLKKSQSLAEDSVSKSIVDTFNYCSSNTPLLYTSRYFAFDNDFVEKLHPVTKFVFDMFAHVCWANRVPVVKCKVAPDNSRAIFNKEFVFPDHGGWEIVTYGAMSCNGYPYRYSQKEVARLFGEDASLFQPA
ncbi:MAG: hypothetical protein LBJ89_01385 [Holosporales bacterium]|jgi:hypothetical protein|nr:hypothetical protein [Holosporales bacterium]